MGPPTILHNSSSIETRPQLLAVLPSSPNSISLSFLQNFQLLPCSLSLIATLPQIRFPCMPTQCLLFPFNGVRKSFLGKVVPSFDGVLAIRSAFSGAAVAVVEIVEPGVVIEFLGCGDIRTLMVVHESGHPVGCGYALEWRVESMLSLSRVCKMAMVRNVAKGRRDVRILSFTVMRHTMFCSTILPLSYAVRLASTQYWVTRNKSPHARLIIALCSHGRTMPRPVSISATCLNLTYLFQLPRTSLPTPQVVFNPAIEP